jgi:hypothetical protein
VKLLQHPAVAYLFLVDMAVDLSMGKEIPALRVLASLGAKLSGSGFEAVGVS